ncbi:MAG: hypothetical protein CMN30_33560 [Sandaracinus sp.]|nr:hypothetical protein [Sandaracinus sp.]
MELLESDERLSFGSAAGALITIAHGREMPSTFLLARQHIDRLYRAQAAPVGVLFVVAHEQGPPDNYKRDVQALLDDTREKLGPVSVAILSRGFVAAVYRSVGTVVLSMTGKRNSVSLHGSVADAADWLVERLPRPATRQTLEDAVAELELAHATQDAPRLR